MNKSAEKNLVKSETAPSHSPSRIQEDKGESAALPAHNVYPRRILDDVLVLLASQRFPTPEKGFISWKDALSSLKRFIRERNTQPEGGPQATNGESPTWHTHSCPGCDQAWDCEDTQCPRPGTEYDCPTCHAETKGIEAPKDSVSTQPEKDSKITTGESPRPASSPESESSASATAVCSKCGLIRMPEDKKGWVTIGRIKVDIETETETFERACKCEFPSATAKADVDWEKEARNLLIGYGFSFAPGLAVSDSLAIAIAALARRAATGGECLMADCKETQVHFCFKHCQEVYGTGRDEGLEGGGGACRN